MQVRLFKPSVGEAEIESIRRVFDRAWLGLGELVDEFEHAWSKFIGCEDSIGVNSCTAALHLALAAFRFPPGKKVLVPVMTFAATAFAAHYNQLQPVFVDCDPETLGISLDDLEAKIDSDCVAVMPVHFGGHPVPMDRLLDLARSRGLKVIEDCAHTQGGEYQGRKLGTWGDIGCFSFEEKKGMTTGDGGMICSDDPELIAPLRPARWVGIDKDTWRREVAQQNDQRSPLHWFYEIRDIGYKFNMNNLAAAIGLAQLNRLPEMNAAKCRAIQRYIDEIQWKDGLRPLFPYDLSGKSSYWLFGVRSSKRDQLIIHLRERGVATSVHYTPLNLQPFWRNANRDTPNAYRCYGEIVSVPLFPDISDEQIDHIVASLP